MVWVTWFLNKLNHCLKKRNLYFLEIFKNKTYVSFPAGSPSACRGLVKSSLTLCCPLRPIAPLQLTHSTNCWVWERQKWILLIFRALKNEVDWCVIKADLSQTSLHCTVTKAVTECGLCNMFNGPILWRFLPTELLSAGQVTVHQAEPYSSITISSAKLTMAAWTHLQHPAKT